MYNVLFRIVIMTHLGAMFAGVAFGILISGTWLASLTDSRELAPSPAAALGAGT